jgi:hypothetical protein
MPVLTAMIRASAPCYDWGMERVTVRTFLQAHSMPKKFGAEYVRANGQRTIITTGDLASSVAKHKASKAVHDCEWEPFDPSRKDGFIEVGQGWIDG